MNFDGIPDPMAPPVCELCGNPSAPEDGRFDAAELLRWLVALWVENPAAVHFVLARIGFPEWPLEEIATRIGTSKPDVSRIAADVVRQFPKLEPILWMHRGARSTGEMSRHAAQRLRREGKRLKQNGPQ